jgi:predicted phage terminase large subunit-like protein
MGFIVKADRPSGDKAQRADPFSVQVNNGNVLMKVAHWNAAYKAELELFPKSRYKDQTDASSGAFNKVIGKKEVKINIGRN